MVVTRNTNKQMAKAPARKVAAPKKHSLAANRSSKTKSVKPKSNTESRSLSFRFPFVSNTASSPPKKLVANANAAKSSAAPKNSEDRESGWLSSLVGKRKAEDAIESPDRRTKNRRTTSNPPAVVAKPPALEKNNNKKPVATTKNPTVKAPSAPLKTVSPVTPVHAKPPCITEEPPTPPVSILPKTIAIETSPTVVEESDGEDYKPAATAPEADDFVPCLDIPDDRIDIPPPSNAWSLGAMLLWLLVIGYWLSYFVQIKNSMSKGLFGYMGAGYELWRFRNTLPQYISYYILHKVVCTRGARWAAKVARCQVKVWDALKAHGGPIGKIELYELVYCQESDLRDDLRRVWTVLEKQAQRDKRISITRMKQAGATWCWQA